MVKLAESYRWVAANKDGQEVTTGGDLSDCMRISFIPQRPGLAQHDLAGVPMVRRFGRGFAKVALNNEKLPGLFFWEQGSLKVATSQDVSARLAPGDMIGKGVAGELWYPVERVTPSEVVLKLPFMGSSKPRGMQAKKRNCTPGQEYLHCVVCKGLRFYLRCSDGAVLISPENFELYL